MSLSIDSDEEWYVPNTLVIRHPCGYEPEKSRIIMHETLHWWQLLGHGFFTWMISEDWKRLTNFEMNGTFGTPGPFLKEFFRKNNELGFSAWILNESLTRYWDMHICGPIELLEMEHKSRIFTDEEFWGRYQELSEKKQLTGPDGTGYSDLVYALAMEGAGGRYADPYNLVIKRTSPKVAGIVFPLAAHFAFQTSRPTDYFVKFVDLLAPYAVTLPPGDVEDLWIDFYFTARGKIFPVICKENERPLFPIIEIRESGLIDHPGYQIVLRDLEYWTPRLINTNPAKEVKRRKTELEDRQVGLLALDILLSTPGIPDHRGLLYQLFAPYVVKFYDDRNWLLGYTHRSELHPEWSDAKRGLSEFQEKESIALNIDKRWKRFQQAKYS
jgi:hypothetical protein